MLDAEEILKRAEKKLKKFSQSQIKGLPSSGKDRPWQNNETTPNKAASLIIKEDNIMDDNLKTDRNQAKTDLAQQGYRQGYRQEYTDGTQTRDKVETNLRQSEDKVETIWRQSGDKVETNLRQSEDKVESQLETTFKTRDKVETTFSSLVGLQRKVVLFIYNECKANRAATTKHISINYIVEALDSPCSSIKKTIQRLTQKGIISRSYVKNGRGGWVTYTMPELVFQEILISEKTRDKVETNGRNCSSFEQKVETQLETNSPSSSSYNINKTTTYGNELPAEWQNVNLDLLQDIGFSERHLKQLSTVNLTTPEIVEESIRHFAFGLSNNTKVKQYPDPLNVLMGVLRKGQAWVENNYKSPQEIAQQEFIARKKAESERLTKLEDEAYQMALDDWKKHLSEDDIKNIISGGDKMTPNRVKIGLHFKDNIWPGKKREYLGT